MRRVAILALTVLLCAGSLANANERIAVVDLRSEDVGDRMAFAHLVGKAFGRHPQVSAIADPALAAALVGSLYDPLRDSATAALADAAAAYGKLDCVRASTAANAAVTALAAVQARGDSVRAELVQAYSYTLLCADAAGNRTVAHRAANRIRTLGDGPPNGIPLDLWNRYPAFDATGGVGMATMKLQSEPTEALVWIDHRRAGTTPFTAYVEQGTHLVAVARGGAATAQIVDVTDWQQTLMLSPPAPAHDWRAVQKWVTGWQTGQRQPVPTDIAKLLDTIGVRVAVFLTRQITTGNEQLEAWGVPPGEHEAVIIGVSSTAQLAELAQLVAETTAAWDRGERPDRQVVGAPTDQGDQPEKPAAKPKSQPWWVYASMAGAVGVGAAILLAHELADDHQRIELTYP